MDIQLNVRTFVSDLIGYEYFTRVRTLGLSCDLLSEYHRVLFDTFSSLLTILIRNVGIYDDWSRYEFIKQCAEGLSDFLYKLSPNFYVIYSPYRDYPDIYFTVCSFYYHIIYDDDHNSYRAVPISKDEYYRMMYSD